MEGLRLTPAARRTAGCTGIAAFAWLLHLISTDRPGLGFVFAVAAGLVLFGVAVEDIHRTARANRQAELDGRLAPYSGARVIGGGR